MVKRRGEKFFAPAGIPAQAGIQIFSSIPAFGMGKKDCHSA
jgi:hypothetical protein